ncbi:MAG: HAD family hydrolase [Pygmaiobacter sp.]
MQIKLICVDMDGTLLRADHRTISKNNIEAIRTALAAGITVVPATGRILARLREQLCVLPPLPYAIVSNGAEVREIASGRVLHGNYIAVDTALCLLEHLWSEKLAPMVYQNDKMLMQPQDFALLERNPAERDHLRGLLKLQAPITDLCEHLRQNPEAISKINVPWVPPEIRLRLFRELRALGTVEVTSSMPTDIEFNAPGTTKAQGVLALCRHLDISPDEVMALGDGENDIDMLRAVGHSVAMGNASHAVQSAANTVTDTNERDGVAKAIFAVLQTQ